MSYHLFNELPTCTHIRNETFCGLDDRHDASRIFVVVMLEPVAVLAELVPDPYTFVILGNRPYDTLH